jgi:hypothetical protein
MQLLNAGVACMLCQPEAAVLRPCCVIDAETHCPMNTGEPLRHCCTACEKQSEGGVGFVARAAQLCSKLMVGVMIPESSQVEST